MSDEVNQYGFRRYIPADIARLIRQECGYGCVVCGCNLWDYEHVDPEFKDAQEHDPAKMALVCRGCHGQVTSGRWSNDKIKEARLNPYCKQKGI